MHLILAIKIIIKISPAIKKYHLEIYIKLDFESRCCKSSAVWKSMLHKYLSNFDINRFIITNFQGYVKLVLIDEDKLIVIKAVLKTEFKIVNSIYV
ncbi:unnamed protein product [Blepharisma stoltei]|uniref:Uncharacterized protein n=1 Tax=Blepharisma stoltei TaxID=1481888 RepID=A0AAU9JI45_9CILI|nr:unnamed protein product [Blepharisma stoltei]